MYKRFASLMNPDKYGFVYDSEKWASSRHDSAVAAEFLYHETYGDGNTAHTPNMAIQITHMTDYLLSMAVALSNDAEFTDKIRFELNRAPDLKDIEFCATVVFRETDRYEKPRYWSLEERKISSSPNKKHDKRYQQIAEWQDGTAAAVYGTVLPSYANGLMRYAYADIVGTWARNQPKMWMPQPVEFLKWENLVEDRYLLTSAWNGCLGVVKAFEASKTAAFHVENLIGAAARYREEKPGSTTIARLTA